MDIITAFIKNKIHTHKKNTEECLKISFKNKHFSYKKQLPFKKKIIHYYLFNFETNINNNVTIKSSLSKLKSLIKLSLNITFFSACTSLYSPHANANAIINQDQHVDIDNINHNEWNNKQWFYIHGSASINDGINLVTDTAYINMSANQESTVTIRSPNTAWTLNSQLIIGSNGQGTLNVIEGAQVLAKDVWLGRYAGSIGIINLEGTDSTLTISDKFHLGHNGSGFLTLKDQAQLNSGETYLGSLASSAGKALIDGVGSTWNITGHLYVASGQNTNGSLTIQNGGVLNNSLSGHLGRYAGANGTAIVQGQGSQWINQQQLYIGVNGTGFLSILDGATVSSSTGTWLGTYADSSGLLIVEGQGSALINDSYISVAHQGDADVFVNKGGKVSATESVIGNADGGKGRVVVQDAGSTWQIDSLFVIGARSEAELVISNGGSVINQNGLIGQYANATGSVTVQGEGSVWHNLSDLMVGLEGSAELTVSHGGVVNTTDTITLASTSTSSGTINIGAAEDNAATLAGKINADKLTFGEGQGSLVFNHTNSDYQFTSAIQGIGANANSAVKVLSGTTIFTGANDYQEKTLITGGKLQAGGSNTLSHASDYTVSGNGILSLDGYSHHLNSLTNNSTVIIGADPALNQSGTTLTINGNYVADNGTLVLNTALNDDDSITDKLHVIGDTAGTTNVVINNIRGNGAPTLEGIKIVQVDGQSDGKFTLKNRVTAGLYEYFLHQNAIDSLDGDWYLRSELPQNPNPEEKVYRPEIGSYLGNMAAASKMFNLRLEDREGRAENSSLWLRQVGSHTRYRTDAHQFRNLTNRYVIQGGGEVFNSQIDQHDRFGLGVMFGYGYAHTNSNSLRSGYSSKGRVDGYNVGIYGTWYQNSDTLNGAYVDSWINYSWLNATVDGEQTITEKYKIKGYSASLESGYRIPLYQNKSYDIVVIPQAQLIWNGLKADNVTERDGTRIQSGGRDNVQVRTGVKIAQDFFNPSSEGRIFTLYSEANWLYNSKSTDVTMNGETRKLVGNQHLGEVKLGTEGNLNANFSLWSNVAQQFSSHNYRDTSVNVGIKYHF